MKSAMCVLSWAGEEEKEEIDRYGNQAGTVPTALASGVAFLLTSLTRHL